MSPRDLHADLHADLQWAHDEFRELLGYFHIGSTRGDRVVRTAEIDQSRMYELLDKLTEIRERHGLGNRG